jgi:xylulose-5-phosphate/fructose-6-phosphate phosphoketolase
MHGPLSPEESSRIDAYWRAANYLSVGQIYLLDNRPPRQVRL